MPVLPIPMVVALILGFLAIRSALRRETHWLFLALISACAVQSILMSLNYHYGFTGFRYIQPTTATLIPPLAFVAFQVTAIRAFDPTRDLPHLIVPAFTAFATLFARETLDFIVLSTFIGYGTALLVSLRKGGDALLHTRLASGEIPLFIWRIIGISLLVSALSDTLIILDIAFGHGTFRLWIIGIFSSLNLLMLGALSLSQSLESIEAPKEAPQPAPIAEEDIALVQRLEALLRDQQPYLDPSLTLAQLARKLRVPAKQLSAAINRVRGENVSRTINAARITHACQLLAEGQNVTEAMLSSGFNTKSNFNREFLRLKGVAPRAWQMANIG